MLNRLAKGRTVVYAMVLADSGYVHEASCHIHCDETVLDLQDGIPKYSGWPNSEPIDEPRRTGIRPPCNDVRIHGFRKRASSAELQDYTHCQENTLASETTRSMKKWNI